MLKQVCTTLALVCIFGCGGGGGGGYSTAPSTPPSGNPPPATDAISVTNDAFTPSALTVAAGTVVHWSWNTCTGDAYSGQTCVAHSVSFEDGVTSPTQDKGSFTRTFATPGTYTYQCAVHGAAMSGKVVVN